MRIAEQREPVADALSGQALVGAGPLVPSPPPRAQVEPGAEQVEKTLGDALVHVEIGTQCRIEPLDGARCTVVHRARAAERRRRAGLRGAGAEPDHRGGDRGGVAGRGHCSRQPGRGDRRARPGRPRIGGAGRPEPSVGQAGGAAPARFEAREAGCARARVGYGQACPHRFARRARAVTPGRLLRLPFGTGRCPLGPGSRASQRAPAMPGLGPCGLRSLSRAPRRPHAGSKAPGRAGIARVVARPGTQFGKCRSRGCAPVSAGDGRRH